MPAALREVMRVDLDGAKAGTVTESEARQAKDRATEIFAQIEARKRPHVWVAPTNVVQAAPAAPALKILKADSTLNNDELLASIEKHITTLKTLMGLPDPAMQKELSRPVVLLLIDEFRTLDDATHGITIKQTEMLLRFWLSRHRRTRGDTLLYFAVIDGVTVGAVVADSK
jgi:hypothetical protein